MQKLTNNREAERTVFTKDGPVKIAPGETAEVDISADAAKDEEAAGMTLAKPKPAAKTADKADTKKS